MKDVDYIILLAGGWFFLRMLALVNLTEYGKRNFPWGSFIFRTMFRRSSYNDDFESEKSFNKTGQRLWTLSHWWIVIIFIIILIDKIVNFEQ